MSSSGIEYLVEYSEYSLIPKMLNTSCVASTLVNRIKSPLATWCQICAKFVLASHHHLENCYPKLNFQTRSGMEGSSRPTKSGGPSRNIYPNADCWWWSNLFVVGLQTPPTSTTTSHSDRMASSRVLSEITSDNARAQFQYWCQCW